MRSKRREDDPGDDGMPSTSPNKSAGRSGVVVHSQDTETQAQDDGGKGKRKCISESDSDPSDDGNEAAAHDEAAKKKEKTQSRV